MHFLVLFPRSEGKLMELGRHFACKKVGMHLFQYHGQNLGKGSLVGDSLTVPSMRPHYDLIDMVLGRLLLSDCDRFQHSAVDLRISVVF